MNGRKENGNKDEVQDDVHGKRSRNGEAKESSLVFLRFILFTSLIAALMALVILSPMVIYPFLLGHGEPYSTVALIFFWGLILGGCLAAGLVDYLRGRRET